MSDDALSDAAAMLKSIDTMLASPEDLELLRQHNDWVYKQAALLIDTHGVGRDKLHISTAFVAEVAAREAELSRHSPYLREVFRKVDEKSPRTSQTHASIS